MTPSELSGHVNERLPDEGSAGELERGDELQPPRAESTPLALPASQPASELPAGPYASSEEHLWDELRRVDQFVRAQTVRWRLTIGANKPEDQWGMAIFDDAEIGAFLRTPFAPADVLPPELEKKLAAHWEMADLMAESIRARRAETPPDVMLRLDALCLLFNLSEFERDVLLICLLPELDVRYRRLYAYLQDDASRKKPSVELILQILHKVAPAPEAARSAFVAQFPLRGHHLIVLNDADGDESLVTRSARVDDRITSYLLGSDLSDDRLKGIIGLLGELVSWEELCVEPELLNSLQALSEWWQHEGSRERGATLFLHGPYGSGRLGAARALCAPAGTPLLVADAMAALRSPLGFEFAVDLAYRETKLQGACIYWARCDQLLELEQNASRWEYLATSAERFQGLTFLASKTSWDPTGHFHEQPFKRLDFHVPGYKLRRKLWEARLPHAEHFTEPLPDRRILAEQLANGFQLTEGQVEDAFASARELAALRDPFSPRLTINDLYEGCRRQSNRSLTTFARRIEPRTRLTFDDLVLPSANKSQLNELRQRIRQRNRVRGYFENRLMLGKGLIALFTGSSGTGKTMAAGLLAQEQGVDLYKVDLSAVVSKYVGETEKNLNRVFAEAEDANAIIFFDEGEALFGQRGSRLETGQDRWANMEVNFLLQRVEEYTGVVIIASNLRQNIDEAFMRRLHVVVEFPFPEGNARLRIWLDMFPEGIDHPADEEIKGLADRFRLSGGQISNVVVDASFRAMAEAKGGTPEITLRHLALAVVREYQKMGKPITKSEFGETFYKWIEQDIQPARQQ